jgi:hypothetical protein
MSLERSSRSRVMFQKTRFVLYDGVGMGPRAAPAVNGFTAKQRQSARLSASRTSAAQLKGLGQIRFVWRISSFALPGRVALRMLVAGNATIAYRWFRAQRSLLAKRPVIAEENSRVPNLIPEYRAAISPTGSDHHSSRWRLGVQDQIRQCEGTRRT